MLINFVKKKFTINSFRLAFLLVLFAATNCKNNNNELQKIEREDHQFCVSLGLDFGEDELKTEIYWRCRITLAKYKIKDDAIIPEDIRRNIMIKKLISDIGKNYSLSYEKWGDKRNSLFDNNDHQSCVTLGYNIDTIDKITSSTTIEDYLACRKRLINSQQIIPPYNKTEYFKRPQDSYNIGFAINKRMDREIAKFEAAKEKYPVCVKFNLKSPEFKTCSLDYDEQRQCLTKIHRLKFRRELQEKSACQKKAYVRFPDSMINQDDEKARELSNIAESADLKNNSSFFSIGIDKDQLEKFRGEETKVIKKTDNQNDKKDNDKKTTDNEKKIAETKVKKNFNTKDDLYSKVDITRLRQQFIFSCQKATEPDLESYGNKLQNECNAIVEKWENYQFKKEE